MRFADYLRTAAKSFRRQPGRTFLTVTAMAISATILMTLAAISLGLGDAARTTLAPDASMNAVVVTSTRTAATAGLFGGTQEVSQGEDKLTDDTVTHIRQTPHVTSAVPLAEVWEFKSFRIEGSEKTFVAQAAGVQSLDRTVAAGATIGTTNAHQVVLGYGYAKELGLSPEALVGKKVTITTQNGYIGAGATIPATTATLQQLKDYAGAPTTLQATVVGVLAQGIDESRVYVPLAWAREVRTHRTNAINDSGVLYEKQEDQLAKDGYSSILVRVDSPADVESVVAAVDAMGLGALSTVAQLKKIMQFTSVIWVGLGAIALVTLLAGALGIVNTMLTAVAEQRYAIGVWRASGATKGVIARMFVIQAAIMGLIGGLIGAALSFGAVQAVNGQLRQVLEAQHIAVVQVASLPWWLIITGVGVTICFAVIAGVYPAWRAARQDPSRALSGN
jgi:putative ABC transport system permease protein